MDIKVLCGCSHASPAVMELHGNMYYCPCRTSREDSVLKDFGVKQKVCVNQFSAYDLDGIILQMDKQRKHDAMNGELTGYNGYKFIYKNRLKVKIINYEPDRIELCVRDRTLDG